ncbi:hypothetical protein FACS1894202_13770 [Clostridia bacterium]|nr:hypothetical protein FACS1894202_13770 [Clostridia bacterium]
MEPIIRVENLCKSFDGVPVLEDVNLEIYPGEVFGVIGKSGAGKSTLARCFNVLERPSSGKIYFGGKELTALRPKELYKARQSMGMIFQQFNLLMQRNVLDNVCFPLEIAGVKRADAKKRAYELLELVGLSEKAKSFPAKLSGGQKQRVAIARAIAPNPSVLLCDEATSALDPETTRDILSLISDINRRFGITIIIITHEMHIIETMCPRVATITDNRLEVSERAVE